MELKQIRDVRHDNLNQFIGACVEPNNILIIAQYASKGSLQVWFLVEGINGINLVISPPNSQQYFGESPL